MSKPSPPKKIKICGNTWRSLNETFHDAWSRQRGVILSTKEVASGRLAQLEGRMNVLLLSISDKNPPRAHLGYLGLVVSGPVPSQLIGFWLKALSASYQLKDLEHWLSGPLCQCLEESCKLIKPCGICECIVVKEMHQIQQLSVRQGM